MTFLVSKGNRVLANILTSVPRINIALGKPVDTSEIELNYWREYMKDQPTHPVINGGPLIENVFEGDDIGITTIPAPSGTNWMAVTLSAPPAWCVKIRTQAG